MKAKPPEKIQETTNPSTRGHWNEMNRKQRREMMRQIQSEDISLEVVHPDVVTGHTVFPRGCQPIFRPLSRIPFLGEWSAVLREHASGIGYSPV